MVHRTLERDLKSLEHANTLYPRSITMVDCACTQLIPFCIRSQYPISPTDNNSLVWLAGDAKTVYDSLNNSNSKYCIVFKINSSQMPRSSAIAGWPYQALQCHALIKVGRGLLVRMFLQLIRHPDSSGWEHQ
jgi:hypothetical protein